MLAVPLLTHFRYYLLFLSQKIKILEIHCFFFCFVFFETIHIITCLFKKMISLLVYVLSELICFWVGNNFHLEFFFGFHLIYNFFSLLQPSETCSILIVCFLGLHSNEFWCGLSLFHWFSTCHALSIGKLNPEFSTQLSGFLAFPLECLKGILNV